MNSLQIELNTINEKLELLTYRKNQLEAVITEYSDVVNRVKNLIDSMQDANVEPSNLLAEIEQLIYCPEQEQEPDNNHEKINSYIIPFDPVLHGEPEPEPSPEPTPEPVSKPFSFDLRLFPKPTPQPTPENLQPESLEAIQDKTCRDDKRDHNTININKAVCHSSNPDTVSNTAVTDVKNAPTPEEPVTDDDNDCDTDGLEDVDYGFDDDADDDEEPIATTHRTPPGSKYFLPMTYWDYEKSVRMFIGKKSRSKGELEAIINDCLCQELAEKYEINECGKDWIVTLSPVTNEVKVNQIIGNFYPSLATPEPTPEPVRLMVAVPAVATPTPTPTPEPTPKTQLNDRAWRRGDTLLIGFTNKRLLNVWAKWFKDSWSDRVKVDDLEKLEGFDYCLSILWHCKPEWERLSKLNYSLKPTEQNKHQQQPETPPKVTLEDVKATLKQLHDDGLPAILKGELLAHHFNSLTPNELEQHLEKLVEQGLINLGELSIMLKFPEPTNSKDNPAFEYEQVDEKTTKIYADGMLLGLAKDCGSHWESPQFKGQTFPNRRDIVNALWELVNKF